MALPVQEHPHHGAARACWESVQLGLVRLLCQPKVVGAGALDLGKACGLYQNFRALSCIDLLADAPDCDTQLQTLLTNQAALPTRLWTNAYLAALAQSAGLRLVSFDKDFARFVNAKNPKLLKFRISGTSKMHLI